METEIRSDVKFTSLHHIDHDSGNIININIDKQSEDLIKYIERLLADIKESSSKRVFDFRSETTEVRAAINLMFNEKYEEAVKITTERLMFVEKQTQLSMDKLGISIQKGSLFQTHIYMDNGRQMIIIGKADHNAFLDASDFSVHNGLPWKRKIFKSFLLLADYEGNVERIMVSDTTNAITKYWWSDFLELEEVRTDTHNTKNFIELLDKKIFNPIKKKFPADHTTLRNSVLGHFRSHDNFDLDTLMDSLFDNYTPIDSNFPIRNIANKVREIPEKYELDSQFGIDKNEINKRAVNKVYLKEGIELVLRGAPDLDDITPYENEEGDKYIFIKTEEGFKHFQKNQ